MIKQGSLVAVAAAFLGGIFAIQGGDEQVVILSGDTQGYLSPCGCSSPMIGGVKRMATVIRNLTRPGRTTLLENGALADGVGRQDELKAETLAQCLADLGVTAINIGPSDARLGQGSMLQLSQLSGEKLISLSVAHPKDHAMNSTISSGPFLVCGSTDFGSSVAGMLGDTPVPLDVGVRTLVDEALEAGLRPVLMLQGSHDSAVRLAHSFPQLCLIQYSSIGEPPANVETIGTTVLATTGERGKHIVRLIYGKNRFTGYKSISLGPEVRDDPVVSRFYSTYLLRVKDENLLDKVPRHTTPDYVGSWACMSCHQEAAHEWKASSHRSALTALEKQDHAFDPECVPCHVTGLSSTAGYRSARTTPQFAGVGCESCHGPGLGHVRRPADVKFPRLTEKACGGCHNPLNSPNFEFSAYWPKVKH